MARPRQITDEQILQTMRSSVLEHGPAVSLDVVAEQLNVTSPALIKRFGTRRALMIAALKPPLDTVWSRHLSKGPDARPLREQLEDVITSFSESFNEAMPCMFALRESGIPYNEVFPRNELSPQIKAVQAVTRFLQQLAEMRLCVDEALETAGSALVGAITHRAISAHLSHSPWSTRDQKEYARQLSKLFTRALSPDNRNTPPK